MSHEPELWSEAAKVPPVWNTHGDVNSVVDVLGKNESNPDRI